MVFKYQREIDLFIGQGYELPQLYGIRSKDAFRYVFANNNQHNHIPPHKLHPNRLAQQIKNERVDLTGFALSNLETEDKAIAFYRYLHKICKNVKKQIGDSLSYGILYNSDGLITSTDSKGHFDLFESDTCILSLSFNIVRSL